MTKKAMFLYFLLVLVVDQLTKCWVANAMHLGQSNEMIPGLFSLSLTYNHGVAFGVFANLQGMWRPVAIGCTTALALGIIFVLFLKGQFEDRQSRLAVSIILAGALGNIIDRVRLGYVIDFLDFFVGTQHWPAFNVADSCICIGVFLLLFNQAASPVAVKQ